MFVAASNGRARFARKTYGDWKAAHGLQPIRDLYGAGKGGHMLDDSHLCPGRHRDRSNPAVLADEIHDAPSPVALLNVTDGQCRDLGPPQPAAQEYRQNRAIRAIPWSW